jgi:hypothetical protein
MTEVYTFEHFKGGGNCDFGPLDRHFPVGGLERSALRLRLRPQTRFCAILRVQWRLVHSQSFGRDVQAIDLKRRSTFDQR